MAPRSEIDRLVLPLLRGMYSATCRTTSVPGIQTVRGKHQLYVGVIMTLIWSGEYGFGEDVFGRIKLQDVGWYRERRLRGCSLGSLLVLVMVRMVTVNLNRMRDEYLLGNTLAVIMNIQGHVRELHPYASLRVAQVTVDVVRRLRDLEGRGEGGG